MPVDVFIQVFVYAFNLLPFKLHGVGVSVVNALSGHLRATVHREGKAWEQEYEKGKTLYPVKPIGTTEKRGTVVTFKPDATIFQQTTEYNYDTLASRMRELSFLNKGIIMMLTDKRQTDEKGEYVSETFHSEEGLVIICRILLFFIDIFTHNMLFFINFI